MQEGLKEEENKRKRQATVFIRTQDKNIFLTCHPNTGFKLK